MIDFSESGFLIEYPDIFRACLFKDYKNTEALLFSNLLVNPLAKINLDILRRNLVISANSVNEPLGLLRLNFPFDNIKLKVKGKVLPYNNTKDKGFLITRLTVTHAKFPFKTIIPNRKNDGRKGKEKEDNLEPAYPVPSGTSQSYNEDGVNGLPITNNDVCNFLDEIEIETFGGLECNNVNIIKEEKERQRYESAMHVPSFNAENGSSVSTGPAYSSQTGTHELSIVTSPASLEDFFTVINCMKLKGYDIESIGISKDITYTERGVINSFPRRFSSVRTWHFTKNKERTRFFVIAKIFYKGNYYYLIEVEHKGTEVLSVAFIYSRDMQEITNDELLLFMRNVAIENGWPFLQEDSIYIKKWKCETIKHNRANVVKSLSRKILEILER